MKKYLGFILYFLLAPGLFPPVAEARCFPELVHKPERMEARLVKYVSQGHAKTPVSIEWFGHSFFRFISPEGTRIVADPFGPELGYPIPGISPHAVTVGREHPHHNSVYIAKGTPIVLRGLSEEGQSWSKIRKVVGDTLIFNVPVSQRTFDMETKGSAFVYEAAGLCVAHLGDVAEPLNDSQLRRLGKVHVALIPIGGTFTVGPEEARKIVDQVRPHVAIPMHYWDNEELLGRFLRGFRNVRKIGRGPLLVRRRKLPPPTQIVVMSHDQT